MQSIEATLEHNYSHVYTRIHYSKNVPYQMPVQVRKMKRCGLVLLPKSFYSFHFHVLDHIMFVSTIGTSMVIGEFMIIYELKIY